jgi:hypothetical protein
MSVSDLGGVQIPPAVAAWINTVVLIFLGLFTLWVVLKVIGFALRRSYNLTPVATARSRDIKPDFLKVDHAAQKQLIERGREFDRTASPRLARALSVTNIGVIASGIVSFISAVFLAFGRIEELDATWHKLSAKDRFVAIVESHPVGFAIALAIIVAALARLVMTFRRAK